MMTAEIKVNGQPVGLAWIQNRTDELDSECGYGVTYVWYVSSTVTRWGSVTVSHDRADGGPALLAKVWAAVAADMKK